MNVADLGDRNRTDVWTPGVNIASDSIADWPLVQRVGSTVESVSLGLPVSCSDFNVVSGASDETISQLIL